MTADTFTKSSEQQEQVSNIDGAQGRKGKNNEKLMKPKDTR